MKLGVLIEKLLEWDEDLEVRIETAHACGGRSEQGIGDILIGDGKILLVSPEANKLASLDFLPSIQEH